jgi:hypothetical protein
LEVTQQAGVHHIRHTAVPDLLLLWNNRQNETFRYQYNQYNPHLHEIDKRFVVDAGCLPTFMPLTPEQTWQLTVDYAGVTAVTLQGA